MIFANHPDQIITIEGGEWQDGVGNCITEELDADADGNGLPDCDAICVDDTNGDNGVNGKDLACVPGYWGTDNVQGDVNLDGNVDASDLGLLLAAWGDCDAP